MNILQPKYVYLTIYRSIYFLLNYTWIKLSESIQFHHQYSWIHIRILTYMYLHPNMNCNAPGSTFVHQHTWITICTSIHFNPHLYINTPGYTCVHQHTWIHILHQHIWIPICTSTHLDPHLYVNTHWSKFVHQHTWIHIRNFFKAVLGSNFGPIPNGTRHVLRGQIPPATTTPGSWTRIVWSVIPI